MINNVNKTALLFGVRNDASIAWQCALTLQESGCNVALSVDPVNLEVVKKISRGMLVLAADVRDDQAITDNIKQVVKTFGKIDYLLHAVAYGNHHVMCSTPPGSTEAAGAFIDIPFDDFMDSFNISAFSLLRICKIARPYLTEGASIVALTYQASQKVFPQYAGMAINKAALENMTKYLAWFFGRSGIRVNAISAGLVMTTSAGGIKGVRTLRKIGKYSAPLGNVVAKDVADTLLFYFSRLSAKVTGNIHYVDGGFNIMAIGTENA